MKIDCIGCGKCCSNKWLVKLTSKSEIDIFGDSVVFGNYIWTNECPFFINNKCTIQNEKPLKCKEYYCEKYFK